MELLFVVQRYGREVAGGAEQFCREYATRLVGRGHGVEVLTSCAVSYVDWANAFPAGDELIDKVLVHRLPARVRAPAARASSGRRPGTATRSGPRTVAAGTPTSSMSAGSIHTRASTSCTTSSSPTSGATPVPSGSYASASR